jgi:hypothetical protein
MIALGALEALASLRHNLVAKELPEASMNIQVLFNAFSGL